MTDVYQAPEADLTGGPDLSQVEKAIAGDYQFSVMGAFAEGRQRSYGVKLTIQIAMLLMFLAIVAILMVTMGLTYVVGSASESLGSLTSFVGQIAYAYVVNPISVGFFMMCYKYVCGEEMDMGQLWAHFGSGLALLGTYILMMIMVMVGFLLLIIPGIYLATAYMFAMVLVVDKNLGPWEALEASRKAVTHNWFGFFGLWMLLTFVNLLAAIPLGIGLIWTIPWTVNTMAVVYRDMFGAAE